MTQDRSPMFLEASGTADEVLEQLGGFVQRVVHVPNPTPERFMKAFELRNEVRNRLKAIFDKWVANETLALPFIDVVDHETLDRLINATDFAGNELQTKLEKLIKKWAWDEAPDTSEDDLREMIDGLEVLMRAHLALKKAHDIVVDQHSVTHDTDSETPTSHP